ncbi:Cof-type HAD-IIB family hydrolase [Clostridium carnis]
MGKYNGVVFFDVDGTLIDCFKGICVPTQSTKEAINKLKELNYLTILATGRPKSCIDKNLINLGFNGYIACNGSYADFKDEVLFNYYIDKLKLNEILEFFKENNIHYMLEGQEKSYISSYKSEKLMELINGANISEESFTDKWDNDIVKCNKIIVINNDENTYESVLNKYNDDFAFMKHPQGISFEMYIKTYTKGYGIEQLINKLGIDREKTYAFGDGENDIEMFQVVKHGIAMGGYHKRLKEYAYDFTEDVENEGIYKGLKKLKLI